MNPSKDSPPNSEGQSLPSLSTPSKKLEDFHIRSTSSKKGRPRSPSPTNNPPAPINTAVLTPTARTRGRPPKQKNPIGRPKIMKEPTAVKVKRHLEPVINVVHARLNAQQFEHLLANKPEILKLDPRRSFSKPETETATFVQLHLLPSLPKLPISKWESACLGSRTGAFKLLGQKSTKADIKTFNSDRLRLAIHNFTKQPQGQTQSEPEHEPQIQAQVQAQDQSQDESIKIQDYQDYEGEAVEDSEEEVIWTQEHADEAVENYQEEVIWAQEHADEALNFEDREEETIKAQQHESEALDVQGCEEEGIKHKYSESEALNLQDYQEQIIKAQEYAGEAVEDPEEQLIKTQEHADEAVEDSEEQIIKVLEHEYEAVEDPEEEVVMVSHNPAHQVLKAKTRSNLFAPMTELPDDLEESKGDVESVDIFNNPSNPIFKHEMQRNQEGQRKERLEYPRQGYKIVETRRRCSKSVSKEEFDESKRRADEVAARKPGLPRKRKHPNQLRDTENQEIKESSDVNRNFSLADFKKYREGKENVEKKLN